MSDLESRLTEALADGADDAPSAVGLAAGARSRARSKRRTKVATVAIAVALCLGVPTAVVAGHDSDDHRAGPSQVATDGSSGRGIPDGMRVESWRDVTALVPDSWGHGSLAAWCAGGGQLEPLVERPGGVAPAIGCATSTYGLSFQELPPGQDRDEVFDWPVTLQTSEGWPPDAYVGAHGIGDILVQVVAPTAQEAQAILGTVRAIGPEGDPNGCPVDAKSDLVGPQDAMAVCRYDEAGRLEQSELLAGSDLEAAEEAVHEAPPAPPPVACDDVPSEAIKLVTEAEDAQITLNCNALLVHGEARELTSDVLYWALSPGWSGSVPDGVSLPSELRSP